LRKVLLRLNAGVIPLGVLGCLFDLGIVLLFNFWIVRLFDFCVFRHFDNPPRTLFLTVGQYSHSQNHKKVEPRLTTGPFMGEEKPDEELMGKRKSSPRLSPAPLGTGTIMMDFPGGNYTHLRKKISAFFSNIRQERKETRFCNVPEYGNITPVKPAGALMLR
jgi:hypothetical protein